MRLAQRPGPAHLLLAQHCPALVATVTALLQGCVTTFEVVLATFHLDHPQLLVYYFLFSAAHAHVRTMPVDMGIYLSGLTTGLWQSWWLHNTVATKACTFRCSEDRSWWGGDGEGMAGEGGWTSGGLDSEGGTGPGRVMSKYSTSAHASYRDTFEKALIQLGTQ